MSSLSLGLLLGLLSDLLGLLGLLGFLGDLGGLSALLGGLLGFLGLLGLLSLLGDLSAGVGLGSLDGRGALLGGDNLFERHLYFLVCSFGNCLYGQDKTLIESPHVLCVAQ